MHHETLGSYSLSKLVFQNDGNRVQ